MSSMIFFILGSVCVCVICLLFPTLLGRDLMVCPGGFKSVNGQAVTRMHSETHIHVLMSEVLLQ